METDGAATGDYYYNVRTRMVEHGRLSPWEHLMGPYASFEEASRALETAKARNDSWDDDDASWGGDED